MSIDISEMSLEQVLPHEHPMILLDELIECNDNSITTQINISDNSPFFDKALNGVPSWVGIEYMAQSIAAFAGIHSVLANELIRVGFLLGSRKYKADTDIFTQGQQVKVVANELYNEPEGLAQFDCQLIIAEQIVASAKVNTFRPQNADELLNA